MLKFYSFLKIGISALIAAHIFAVTLLSCVPPISRDALSHHLAVPKLYLEHGSIYEIPSVIFSYFPMNLDLLYIIPLYFGNDILPKYIHFLFALFSGWLIFIYLKHRLNTVFALVGALFFLSVPIIVKLSITVYVDLGLIFFSTASLLSLFQWMSNNFKRKYLIISGICCGLAIGTKYNGIIVLILLSLFIPIIYLNGTEKRGCHQRNALFMGALFLAIALFIFSPWMVRNYIWTKNPLYPMFHSIFNSKAIDSEQLKTNDPSSGIKPLIKRKVIYNETLLQIMLLPIRLFFQGKDNNHQYFDGKLNPFLLILPLFAFIRKKTPHLEKEKKILLSYSILFLGIVFFYKDMRIRYIAPIIPPLVILTILGVENIYSVLKSYNTSSKKIPQSVLFLLISSMIGLNTAYIFSQFKSVDPLSYISGQITRDVYIKKHRPEYAAIQYINTTLSNDSKILGIFLGNRRYYFNREVIFTDAPFKGLLRFPNAPEKITEYLMNERITHFVIAYTIFNSWANSALDQTQRNHLLRFLKTQTTLLFAHEGYGVYQINSQFRTDVSYTSSNKT